MRINAQEALLHEWITKKIRHGSSLPELARANEVSAIRSPRKIIRIQEMRVNMERCDQTPRKVIKGNFLS